MSPRFCRRGRRRTIRLLSGRRGIWRRRIRLILSSCSSLVWEQEDEDEQRRRGTRAREGLVSLLKLTDRNTCATVSRNAAHDQRGPRTLSLCHGCVRPRLSSSRSELPRSFPPPSLLSHFDLAAYRLAVWRDLPTGMSVIWRKNKTKTTLSVLVPCSWWLSLFFFLIF